MKVNTEFTKLDKLDNLDSDSELSSIYSDSKESLDSLELLELDDEDTLIYNNKKNKDAVDAINKKDKSKLYLGHHMNALRWGFESTINYLESIGGNFFQIFLSNPKRFKPNTYPKDQLNQVKYLLNQRDIKMVVHANYMLNFCHPYDSEIYQKAVIALTTDMTNSYEIGAIGVVVHMGKNVSKLELDESGALDNYVKGIKEVLKNTPSGSTLIFETAAGQGTEICTRFSGLKSLYNKFNKEEQQRIKFCIDTCHIFAAGYDIGDHDYVEVICKYVDRFIGWDKVACIHLNDSKCPLNSRKDRHADIGKGYIRIRGLKKFVRFCYKQKIPITLETPCDHLPKKDQIKLVKSWVIKL